MGRLLVFAVIVWTANAITSYEPPIAFVDGQSRENLCRTRLERRVTGMSGIIYSHSDFGVMPYNASKNCFMILSAPARYRIRLRVIEFDVLNHGSPQCDKDTLHIFDHEPSDDDRMKWSSADAITPGPIIGQFCGRRNASVILAESATNTMFLWWHTDAQLPKRHHGKGFHLHWTAFRETKTGPCHNTQEFSCDNDQCIPAQLACNKHADCADGSDLLRFRQAEARCENIDLDPISSITGLSVLLLSATVVLLVCCSCICVCACCKFTQKTCQPKNKEFPAEAQGLRPQQPFPPTFQPPSPPKQPPHTGVHNPQLLHNIYVTEGRGRAHLNSQFSIPVDMPYSDNEHYAYVREPLRQL